MRWLLLAILALAGIPAEARAQGEDFPPPDPPPRLTAVRTLEPMAVDGRLDEEVWRRAEPAAGFRQVEPDQSAPASEETEVRVAFDEWFLYFGITCRDRNGERGYRVQGLRRDFHPDLNDLFGIVLDPHGDGASLWAFEVSPAGALRDLQVTDGLREDDRWDAVWRAEVHRSADGWTTEVAIPWSSLRYPAGASEWAVNFQRRVRRVNEIAAWSPWPRSLSPYRTAYAGRLVGLDPPPPGRNLRLQPYALAREPVGSPDGDSPDGGSDADAGFDLKWVPTPATVVDLTVNTDFAQTDVDRQVVNLERFSVFFPEKRAFFLESAGVFDTSVTSWIQPFSSRRIGLDDRGQPVPIEAGLRTVRQTETSTFGALAMRSRGDSAIPASDFLVARYSRSLGPRHRIGGILTGRHDEAAGGEASRSNGVVGIDYLYRPRENVTFDGLLSGSRTAGGSSGVAGAFWLSFRPGWGYAGWLQYVVSPDYDPGVGFVARRDLIFTSPAVNLDWRPAWRPTWVRSLQPGVAVYLYHGFDDLELQQSQVVLEPIDVRLENGGHARFKVIPTRQVLDRPFSPVPGIEIARGDYDFVRYELTAGSDPSRAVSAFLGLSTGGFYDGDLDTGSARLTLSPTPRLLFSTGWERNRMRNLGSDRTGRDTDLATAQLRLALNPRLQLSTFYQYNTASEQSSWNARFSWEIQPLSYLYVVYNEAGPTDPGAGFLGLPDREDRQLVVKLTYLWQL